MNRPVRGIIAAIAYSIYFSQDQIRVQWSPTKISSGDLLCLYSHDPSDDWEDLITDLNATDFPNPNGNGDTHEMNNNIPGNLICGYLLNKLNLCHKWLMTGTHMPLQI